MEREYKWMLAGRPTFDALIGSAMVEQAILGQYEIHMQAIYYDTEDRLVAGCGGALRLRRENGTSVCCLKLDEQGQGAWKARKEYEVRAQDIEGGLAGLASMVGKEGAHALCLSLKGRQLMETCRTDFVRSACHLRISMPSGACEGELAFDFGEMACGARSAPLCELEFEHIAGDEQPFHDFAEALAEAFCLMPQPLSKMARAMGLSDAAGQWGIA